MSNHSVFIGEKMDLAKTDKRSAIIKAALELIAEHGFHGSPTSMIADRANVGMGTIYRYFVDKDKLIIEVHREVETKLLELLNLEYPNHRTIKERFVYFCSSLLRYMVDNPIEFKFLEQFYNSPFGVALRRDRIFTESTENDGLCLPKILFEQGKAQQIIKDLPLVVLFALVFGSIIAVARDHILGFVNLDDNLIDKTVEACWDAVKQ